MNSIYRKCIYSNIIYIRSVRNLFEDFLSKMEPRIKTHKFFLLLTFSVQHNTDEWNSILKKTSNNRGVYPWIIKRKRK